MKEKLEKLLDKLARIYPQSKIHEYCKEKGLDWHYSLINTSLQPDGILIIGFNWGVSRNNPDGSPYKHVPQSKNEFEAFNKADIASLSRTLPYFDKFGKDFLSNVSQTNYCFFRSKTESQIHPDDIDLCKPIFEELISILQPKTIFSFSASLRKHLIDSDVISQSQTKTIFFPRGNQNVTASAVVGFYKETIPIMMLPHPQARLSKKARDELWDFAIEWFNSLRPLAAEN